MHYTLLCTIYSLCTLWYLSYTWTYSDYSRLGNYVIAPYSSLPQTECPFRGSGAESLILASPKYFIFTKLID